MTGCAAVSVGAQRGTRYRGSHGEDVGSVVGMESTVALVEIIWVHGVGSSIAGKGRG